MKVWSGSAWAEKPTKVWSGSAWVAKPVKIWNGSAWVVKPPTALLRGDDFERANANLEASPVATGTNGGWSWTHDGLVAGALTISSGKLNCNTTNATGSAYKTPSVGTADHYVEFSFAGAVTDNTGAFVCCRLADRNNFVGVRVGSDGSGNNGRIEVYRRVSGTLTALRTPGFNEAVNGDIIKLQCVGTNWAVLKNGAAFTSGAIGASLTDVGTGLVARSVSGVSIANYITAAPV